MKIRILNRNLDTIDDYTSSHVYEIDEAPVLTNVKNETLDSGTFVISNLTKTLEANQYDVIEVLEDDNTFIKYMCVDTITETITCVSPRIYRYEINVFSETKQLENTILPNLKITKMPNITRSIYCYINQYMSEYCPKIRIGSASNYTFQPLFNWTYDDNNDTIADLEEKFSDECPEMQWNTPTLREVLNDLMMVKDCIPVLDNGKLKFMDLTEVNDKNWSDDSLHINYVTKSKSSEDFVSELQVKLENVTDSSGSFTTRVEYVPFTTEDTQVALKDSNAFVKTKYPIYKLKSLKMMFPGKYSRTAGATEPYEVIEWMEYDLCSVPGLICEYQEWITKPIVYLEVAPINLSQFGNSQNWSLYYTRGSNKIENFFNKTKEFLWIEESLLESLTRAIVFEKSPSDSVSWQKLNSDVYYKAMFKIEYETLEGNLFRASKKDYPEHERIVIDNQTNSYVDSYAQGFLEYQKANRLGNEQLQINARFETGETPIQIGDMFDDCVIYQVQYQYFKNHTEVNALATKNYVLREYFTGVKSKIRSWAIASGSEALTRHDLKKNYLEFSYRKYNTMDNDIYFERRYFLTPLITYTAEPISYAAIQNYSSRRPVIPDPYKNLPTYYATDLVTRIIGNSIVFTFGFEDNYFLEKSVNVDEINLDDMSIDYAGTVDWADTIDLGGIPVKQYSYTDDIGEIDWCEASFCSNIKVIPRIGTTVYTDPVDGGYINPSTSNEERRMFVFFSFLRPRIVEQSFFDTNQDIRYVHFYHRFTHHKDSQEIPVFSTQLEFCSENNDIIIGKEFVKQQKAVSQSNNTANDFYLKLFETDAYNFRRPDELPRSVPLTTSAVNVACIDEESSNTTIYISLNDSYDTREQAVSAMKSLLEEKCAYLVHGYNGTTPLLALNDVPENNCTALAESVDYADEPWLNNYDVLEYIQNSGTQYINLGFVPNTNEWWSFNLDYTDVSGSGSNYVMGSRVSSGTIYFGVTGASATKAITIANTDLTIANNYRKANRRYKVNASYNGTNSGTCALYNETDNEFFDGEQNVSLSGSTANVCLFALQPSNIHSGMKVHSLTVMKGTDVIREMIPVREKTGSQRIGMYDRINNVFYPNSGTGTFTAGPDAVLNKYYPSVKFYLNVLRSRNKNIYDNDNHYLIVDKI